MQLPEPLIKQWMSLARAASRTLAITREGVVLGKTLLAPFRQGRLAIDEARNATGIPVSATCRAAHIAGA